MSASVFPARAGMSPVQRDSQQQAQRVPRASGDEPLPTLSAAEPKKCSPRERG